MTTKLDQFLFDIGSKDIPVSNYDTTSPINLFNKQEIGISKDLKSNYIGDLTIYKSIRLSRYRKLYPTQNYETLFIGQAGVEEYIPIQSNIMNILSDHTDIENIIILYNIELDVTYRNNKIFKYLLNELFNDIIITNNTLLLLQVVPTDCNSKNARTKIEKLVNYYSSFIPNLNSIPSNQKFPFLYTIIEKIRSEN